MKGLMTLLRFKRNRAAAVRDPAARAKRAVGRGTDPLTYAISKGNTEMALDALRSAAEADASLADGPSALSAAVDKRLGDVVDALVDRGVDPFAMDTKGRTAWDAAFASDNCDALATFARLGSKSNAVMDSGITPLTQAIRDHRDELALELLRTGAPTTGSMADGNHPLIEALSVRSEAVATAILDAGTDFDWLLDDGRTPLMYAIDRNLPDIAMAMLAKGANPCVSDEDAVRPLTQALDKNMTSLALAIAKRETWTWKDEAGRSPVSAAAARGAAEVVAEMIARGADLSVRNKDGTTALSTAARHGHTTIALELMRAGADVNLQDGTGHTPLTHAISQKQSDLALALIKEGADVDAPGEQDCPPMLHALLHEQYDVAKALVKPGVAYDFMKISGTYPVNWALKHGQPELFKALVLAGASADRMDSDGATPLDLSLQQGLSDITHFVLAKGENFDRCMRSGETPLTYMLKQKQEGLAVLLLDKGVSPTKMNTSDQSPLDLAKRFDLPVAAIAISERRHALGEELKQKDAFAKAHQHAVGALDVGALKPTLDRRHLVRDADLLKAAAARDSLIDPDVSMDTIASELVDLFLKINFHNAAEPAYIDPAILEEDGRVYSASDAVALLAQFVQDVQHNAKVHGASDNVAHRRTVSTQMEKKLRRVHGALKNAAPYTQGMVLAPLALSTKHCLQGRLDALDLAESTLEPQTASRYKLPEHVARVLKNHRKELIDRTFNTAPDAERRHGHQWWMHRTGAAFGIPEAVTYPEFKFQRELYLGKGYDMKSARVEDRFFDRYTADGMIQELQRAVNAHIDDPSRADPNRSIKFDTLSTWVAKMHLEFDQLLDDDYHLTAEGARKVLFGLGGYLVPSIEAVRAAEPSTGD